MPLHKITGCYKNLPSNRRMPLIVTIISCLALFIFLFAFSGFAQAQVSLDYGFDPNADGRILTIVIQDDGKILVGGYFTEIGGVERNYIARLNPDGSVDTTFDPGTGASFSIWTIVVQDDGKILIGGQFTNVGGVERNRIARLNPDGSVDSTFNPGTGANSAIYAIALQEDGKILAGGDFSSFNGNTDYKYLVRLNNDGSLDTGYNPQVGNTVKSIVLTPGSGQILIGGNFPQVNGIGRNRIARLNPDGSLDETFDPGTGANGEVYALAIKADGRILLGGSFSQFNSVNRASIAELETDGTLTAFNPNLNNAVYDLVVEPDGRLLIGGTFIKNTTDGQPFDRVGRLNADGSFDDHFVGWVYGDVNTLALQPDGKILIGGFFDLVGPLPGEERNNIARLNPDGSAEKGFNPAFNAAGVNAIALQPDGKILVGGINFQLGGAPRKPILRFDSNGNEDTTFTANLGTGPERSAGGPPWIYALAVQPDGKILVGGIFDSFNGNTAYQYLARLNPDGTLDSAFIPPEMNGPVLAIAVMPDTGNIVIGGQFTEVHGLSRKRIAGLTEYGTFDSSFSSTLGGANDLVRTIAIEAAGTILIGGDFTDFYLYDGLSGGRGYMVRLDDEGDFLNTLTAAGPDGPVRTIVPDKKGNIYVGGNFTEIGGQTRTRIACLDAGGSATAFNATVNNLIETIALQNNGKIIIGGIFNEVNSTTRNRIARLDETGSLDLDFDPNAGNTVIALAVQKDGKILVGGEFPTIGGVTRNRLARLADHNAALYDLFTAVDGSAVYWKLNGSSPNVRRVTFEQSTDRINWSNLGVGTYSESNSRWQLTGLSLPLEENLYIRARGYYSSGNYNSSASIVEAISYFYIANPAAPTAVNATDGTHSDKVVITWTKSPGATGYQVYRDGTPLGWLGDVATYSDFEAGAPTITAGTVSASEGTSTGHVVLSISGSSANPGSSHTYTVKARNFFGESGLSSADTGYRGTTILKYQWQRSADDINKNYSNISGATTISYNDTGAPAPTVTPGTASASDGTSADHVVLNVTGSSGDAGEGRYYRCVVSMTGAENKTSGSDRGYRGVGLLTYQWYRSARDSDIDYSAIRGATTNPYNDTGAPADGSGRYYVCVVSARGAVDQPTNSDRGYRSATTEVSVATDSATLVGTTSATLNLNFTMGTYNPVSVRFAYMKSGDSTWFYTDWVEKTTAGTHSEPLTGFDPGSDYEFKAQLKYNSTEIEGDILQFTTDAAQSFTDVPPDHPFYEEIEELVGLGITTGWPDGTFRPTLPVTRQAMAAFLYRAFDLEVPDITEPTFTDVDEEHPFFEEIEALAASGITTGWPDGTFRPDLQVTRMATVAFLYRALGLTDPGVTVPTFSDVPTDHPYFKEIEALAATGVTTGWPDGTFRPDLSVTRQAMAAFLIRALALDDL